MALLSQGQHLEGLTLGQPPIQTLLWEEVLALHADHELASCHNSLPDLNAVTDFRVDLSDGWIHFKSHR